MNPHQPTLLLASVLLSRTWWLFIFAAASRDQGAELLALFYPDRQWFYLSLIAGLIPFSKLIVVKPWQRVPWRLQAAILTLMTLADIGYQLKVVVASSWDFHLSNALLLWLAAMSLWLLLRALFSRTSLEHPFVS
ncbi:DUF2919 family protein [Aliagarivorans marinus]|uniref:DUF2919 family protein n=1 Tax=Aliagarivorans marinus TaxID=561965 RepID=UPI0004231032|nr:DUF2919 family protein [Aliagarivorans marinus]